MFNYYYRIKAIDLSYAFIVTFTLVVMKIAFALVGI